MHQRLPSQWKASSLSSAARIETALLQEVSAEVRFVLGNQHYPVPDLHQCGEQADRFLVTMLEDLSVSLPGFVNHPWRGAALTVR